MASVKNYYEELNISQDMSLEDINKELDQIENTWKMREMSNPEKAATYIELVEEARPIFASGSSRQEYESALNKKEEPIAEDLNLAAYKKALNDAKEFLNSKQYDVAKISIERALGLIPMLQLIDTDYIDTYCTASAIYVKSGLYDDGVRYSNELIATLPDFLPAYKNKMIALYDKIEYLRKNNQDYSANVDVYRTTCSMLERKAREQGYTGFAHEALEYLSESYCNHHPVDYDMAEQLANEMLIIDPNSNFAKQILKFVEAPKNVGLDELDKYEREVSIYTDEIYDMVKQIVSDNMTPTSDKGWALANKDSYGWYNPDKDGNDNEIEYKTTYLLSLEGKFIKWVKKHEETLLKDAAGYHQLNRDTDHFVDCEIDELMMETDFDVYGYHANGKGWAGRTSFASNIRSYNWTYSNTREIKRLYRKKGAGLYKKLKAIIDEPARYMAACKEVNEKYLSELEPMRKAVTDEYAEKRKNLVDEKNRAIEQAKNVEPRRNELLRNVSDMQRELSSLGFFSGKRKNELQELIDGANRELHGLPSVADINSKYNREISDLNNKEKNRLSRLEDDMRKKYPLPQR